MNRETTIKRITITLLKHMAVRDKKRFSNSSRDAVGRKIIILYVKICVMPETCELPNYHNSFLLFSNKLARNGTIDILVPLLYYRSLTRGELSAKGLEFRFSECNMGKIQIKSQ